MKFRQDALTLSGALALMLCACEEQPRVVEVESTPTPAPQAAATPKTVAATPSPPPAKKGLYLARRISITNDSGIFGFAPGTELELVSKKGDTLVVRVKDVQFEVKESDTTTDVSAIAAAAKKSEAQLKAQQAEVERKKKIYANQMEIAARAAEKARRQNAIAQLNAQIQALATRRDAVARQLYSTNRDPNKTPEGKAKLAELDRIDLTIRQLYAQIAQIHRGGK